MYEGNILNLGMVAPLHETELGIGGLHVLNWAELVARLGAARDYRNHMKGGERIEQGSFHFVSARHIAAFRQQKPRINPFALADHKAVAGMCTDMSLTELTGDRGRQ